MKARRKRLTASVLGVVSALGWVVLAASPAAATCAIYPGTNPIRIKLEDVTHPVIEIPGTPEGLVGICVTVAGDPNPQPDLEPTADVGTCGVPCFVVAWDGVVTDAVTISVTVYADETSTTFQRTIPAGSHGGFCINAGMLCPE